MQLIKRIAAFAALALCGPVAQAAILDAEGMKAAIQRGAIVWDVRPIAEYRRGHIPEAVTIGEAGSALRDENAEDFLDTEKVEAILGAAGIDPAAEVVVYGNRGSSYAYFGGYALRYFGGRNVHVYHDGIDGWVAAGNPVSTQDHTRPPVALKLKPNPEIAASTADVVARVKGRADVQLIDARTVEEFRGEDIRAIRGGHIPGAVNIPYEQNWRDPETPLKLARRQVPDTSGMTLKSRDELKALYAGLDPNKETIVYCQSGVRAAETAGVLESLGFRKVKVYDSSWLGYAARLDAPAANETFFNVGQLRGQIGYLMRRLDQLERELAESRAQAARRPGICPGGAANC